MDYVKVILRMIFFYFFIILIYRIMGKREVGQLGIVDLIVSILIAELVAISVEDIDKSIMASVVPIFCLVGLQIILSFASLKNPKLRELLDGSPAFIIKNGRVNYSEMVRQKYNLDDLLSQLREKGYKSIEEIEYAILESNGTLSVFPYEKQENYLPLPLILDSKIQEETLRHLHKDSKWALNLLERKNININDVFYAFYKDKNIFIIKNSDLI